MRSVGCAVGKFDCVGFSLQHNQLINAHIFVCIFAYKRCGTCEHLAELLAVSTVKLQYSTVHYSIVGLLC